MTNGKKAVVVTQRERPLRDRQKRYRRLDKQSQRFQTKRRYNVFMDGKDHTRQVQRSKSLRHADGISPPTILGVFSLHRTPKSLIPTMSQEMITGTLSSSKMDTRIRYRIILRKAKTHNKQHLVCRDSWQRTRHDGR